jgi:hypothetical protein
MKKIAFLFAIFFLISFAVHAQQTQTQGEARSTPEIQIDKKADELMHRMSDLLANAKEISFRTKGTEEKVRSSGKKVAVQVTREVTLRRPDGYWMHIVTQAPDRSRDLKVWYDGKTLTLQSDKEKVYAHTKMPPTLDESWDFVGSTLNMPTPMADLLYSSPYDAFFSDDTVGGYVKLEKIGAVSCHQLAFKNRLINWRIWIADGQEPKPCKLELTYKKDIGKPVYSIAFLDWNFHAQIAENQFVHEAPADYQKIKIVGREPLPPGSPDLTSTQTQEH